MGIKRSRALARRRVRGQARLQDVVAALRGDNEAARIIASLMYALVRINKIERHSQTRLT